MTTVHSKGPSMARARDLSANGSNVMLANVAETWLAATAEWQRELIDFVSSRLEKDAETGRAIMACKNLADVTAIQSRWVQDTLRDYSGEMSRLMTICAAAGNAGTVTKQ